ncbi:sugar ABC transporter substrate-binding protein [Deinococcus sp.]|uniref:ABC transporter substrate-binding protein n=1 Tax=Deinococcus sp. TaxID=47478 RepID=UPI002869C14D|nr:sugar ABC transporter substrate-binding protein [Deinococcus sp.]
MTTLKFTVPASLLLTALCLGSAQAQTTLQILDYFTSNPTYDKAMAAAIQKYEAATPGIKIQRTSVQFGDLKNRIIQATATRTVPDILFIDNPDHQAMASQGSLADITSYLKGSKYIPMYQKGPLSSTIYQGKNYGLPYISNATVLYSNDAMLKAAGVKAPLTWDELRATAKKLTTNDHYGFCMSGVGTEEGTFTFLPFLWSTGSDLQRFGDAGTIKALTYWGDLYKDKSISRAAVNWSQGDVYQQFIAQKCAMMINGPWQLPNFANDKVTFKWGVSAWPKDMQPVSILGGENLALGNGPHVADAWKFVSWLVQPENLKPLMVAAGSIPNRTDIAKGFTTDPVVETFIKAVAVAKPRAYGPKYPQISEQVWIAFQSVATGAKTPEKAAQDAAAAIKPLFK